MTTPKRYLNYEELRREKLDTDLMVQVPPLGTPELFSLLLGKS
jgi:hypothetical protein